MENNQPAVVQKTASQRFTEAVTKEFAANAGNVNLTEFQKKLINNYFIKLDQSLQLAEVKRMKTPEQKREPLAYKWENINLTDLALKVVPLSSVGLDPLQPNHVNLIPYKNGHTNKYEITPIIGYRGLAIKALKFALDELSDVIVEVVHANDTFKIIKKDANNAHDAYIFQINDPFNRGEIIGGFYYQMFSNAKANRLRVLTLSDIEKRKPKYASAEFWGGEKDTWEGGKKVGKEKVDGWYEEMVYKTVYRAAFNDVTIDSNKINAQFAQVQHMQDEFNHDGTIDIKHEIVTENASVPLEIEAPKRKAKEQRVAAPEPIPTAEPSAMQPNIEFDLSEEPEF